MTVNYRTFATHFEDALQAPYEDTVAWGKWDEVNHVLRTGDSPNSLSQIVSLMERLFHSNPLCGALGTLVKNRDGSDCVFHLVFGLHKYVASLEEVDEGLVDTTWGFVDDVDDGIYTAREWKISEYTVEPVATVYNYQQHHNLLVADGSINMHAPIADGAQQSEAIVPRSTAFVPFELVPLFLGKGLSARDAFIVLFEYLEGNNIDRAHCSGLLDLLRAGGTRSAAGDLPAVVQTTAGSMTFPSVLLRKVTRNYIYRLLPGLGPTEAPPAAVSTDPNIITLAASVNTLVETSTNQIEAQETRRADAVKPKTYQAMYSESGLEPLLLNYLGLEVTERDQVPEIYTSFANAPKKISRQVMFNSNVKSIVTELRKDEQTADISAPTCTPKFSSNAMNLVFTDHNRISLGGGISLFEVAPSHVTSQEGRVAKDKILQANLEVEQIATHEGFVSVSDMKKVNSVSGFAPGNWDEAELQLSEYRCPLQLLIGMPHKLYVEYNAAVNVLLSKKVWRMWKAAMTEKYGVGALGPVLTIYLFDYYIQNYFEEIADADEAAVPPLKSFIARFRMHKKVEDIIPGYSDIPILRDFNKKKGNTSPPDTGGTRAKNSDDKSKNEVKNSNWDLRFKAPTVFGKAVQACKIGARRKELLEQSDPVCVPTDENGNERCLNWHLKGRCNKHCDRASDHKALDAGGQLDMFNYATEMCPGP